MAHVEEHPNTSPSSRDSTFQSMESPRVSCFPTCFLASADDRQNQYPELGGSLNAGEGQIPLSQRRSPFFIQDSELGDFSSAGDGQIPVSQRLSPFFIGRKDVLDKLRKIFFRTGRRRSCFLWGMGGIGKTQICLKFIEEMSDR